MLTMRRRNGGNVTEQTYLRPGAAPVGCQSDLWEWGAADQATFQTPTNLNIFRTTWFIFLIWACKLPCNDIQKGVPCSHWTRLTDNVGFHSLSLPDFPTPTRQAADLLPKLFLLFLPPHLRHMKRFPLGIFVSGEILFTITQLYPPSLLLMLLVSLAPSLSLFPWVTWDKNLQWSWRKHSVWRDRLQQRDTDIWRGFLMESNAGREELVHSVFPNVGFWDRKN